MTEHAMKGDSGIEYLDIDERSQRLVVGLDVLSEEQRHETEAFLKDNDIPLEAVEFVEIGRTTLELMGGDQLDLVPIDECTNGFIAVLDEETVSVTAGHCESLGDVDTDGDQEFEFDGDLAGTEIEGTNLEGPRFSDSLLFDPVISTTQGAILKNSTSEYTITGKKLFPAQGEAICKMGITTGETCGAVQTTGVNLFNEAATPYGTLWMMAHADYDSDDGDSGAPVYKKLGNDEVTLYGIHRGLTEVGQTVHRTFSPVNNIPADQGELSVAGSGGGIGIKAKDINTGQEISGLFVNVYDDNSNLLDSGYTPLYLTEVAHGETYHIDYSNYGDYYFTSTDSSEDWHVANWGGGRVSVVADDSQVKDVYGIFYNHASPGDYAKITYEAEFSNGTAINGMWGGFKDSTGVVLAQGWSSYTVGVPINEELTVVWNNFGSLEYQHADPTPSGVEILDTQTAWGGEQVIELTTSGASYTDTGIYS